MEISGVPIDLDRIGVVSLCILAVIGYVKGWIVTPRELAQVTHDRDEWRAESRIKDAQIAERDKQLQHLAEVGKTVEQLARGLQQEIP